MTKRKITVAVSGLNNIDSPGPGIPVIRALKESELFDVRIIGLSYENLEPGLYMRDLVDKSYSIPLPSSGTASLLERLRYIHDVENIDVISSSASLSPELLLIRFSEIFKAMGAF